MTSSIHASSPAARSSLWPVALLVAALAAGVAIGRLAALVNAPIGQRFVVATVGFVLVVVPAWTLIAPAV